MSIFMPAILAENTMDINTMKNMVLIQVPDSVEHDWSKRYEGDMGRQMQL
jgi:hypothetical protein